MYEAARKIKSINEIRYQPSVIRLDDYIKSHERRFGKIKIRLARTSTRAKLCQSFEELKVSLRREKCHCAEAYGHLKDTNEIMRMTIAELRDGFKTCRESIRNEFEKIESVDTERLLSIDPSDLYLNYRARQ